MTWRRLASSWLILAGVALVASGLWAAERGGGPQAPAEDDPRPAAHIQDNSFLVEEAYNQEPRVVQHIFVFGYAVDKKKPGADDWRLSAAFTQEWPVFSQKHQLS